LTLKASCQLSFTTEPTLLDLEIADTDDYYFSLENLDIYAIADAIKAFANKVPLSSVINDLARANVKDSTSIVVTSQAKNGYSKGITLKSVVTVTGSLQKKLQTFDQKFSSESLTFEMNYQDVKDLSFTLESDTKFNKQSLTMASVSVIVTIAPSVSIELKFGASLHFKKNGPLTFEVD